MDNIKSIEEIKLNEWVDEYLYAVDKKEKQRISYKVGKYFGRLGRLQRLFYKLVSHG